MATELVDPRASVQAYLAAEKADNTRKAYSADFADFSAWCEKAGEQPLPAEPLAVARYIAQLADSGLKASTIVRRCSAIRSAHLAAGYEPPTNAEGVKATMRGIRRTKGTRPVRKAPATAQVITKLLAVFPDTLAGVRDRALVLTGFGAALRRSEIVDLNVNDITFWPEGMVLHLRRSKTDQEGAGRDIPVPAGNALMPVAALQAWLEAAKITEGPVFREVDRHGKIGAQRLSDRSVARIIKRAVRASGSDERAFSGHSLRAGFITESLDRGVDPFLVMGISRHVKMDTLRIYDRRKGGFSNHAGKGFL